MHEDTKRYVASCPECQRTGNISQINSMPFKNSCGYEHILVMVDYVSK
jgi:hypothetical protein